MRKWAAVIGSPIEHSLSPVLHRTAFSLLDLDWEYSAVRVERDHLARFLGDLDVGCVGLSVTAPLKRELLSLVDMVDGLAKVAQAANTVARTPGMDAAFNTDVHGIVESVRPHLRNSGTGHTKSLLLADEPQAGPLAGQPAPVIIGTGATASSAMAAVRSLGASRAYMLGRNFSGKHSALAIAYKLGLDLHTVLWRAADRYTEQINQAPLVISTVPPAVTGDLARMIEPLSDSVLLDVTYSSHEKPLESRFASIGAPVVSPLAMLTLQGLAQVKIWTARDVAYEPVYEAVVEAAQAR